MDPENKMRRFVSGWHYAVSRSSPYGVHWGNEDFEAGWAKGKHDHKELIRLAEENYGCTMPVFKIVAGTVPM